MSQHHDPVHPDSDHLTPEVLADLEFGLLDAESREHAELHLAHCAACSAVRGDFAALADALADLPDEPMPDAVWEGLASALAAEPVATPAGAATVVPIDAARKRRWGRPGIGLVAGVAGVALLGAIVVPSVLSGSGNSTFSDNSGEPLVAEDGPSDLPMDAYAATRSRTTYDADALDDQVTKLVAARRTLSPSPVPTAQGTATTSPSTQDESSYPNGALTAALATDPAAAQACLEGYIPDVVGVPPLAIDIGKWEGEPAAIIVMPNPDPTLVDVWVIDPDCSIPDEPLIYFATVAR